MSSIKKVDIKEFRKDGYLQELNRQFLHPLGMALEVTLDGDGNETISGIQDFRKDEEGVYYDIANDTPERKEVFKKNFNKVKDILTRRTEIRKDRLGFATEKIPK